MAARDNARNIRRTGKRAGRLLGPIDTFNFENYEPIHIEETAEKCNIVIRLTGDHKVCIYCHDGLEALFPWGSKIQSVSDVPVRGKPCTLAIDRQRYRCEKCKHFSSMPLPGLHPKRRMTLRLFNYIRDAAALKTFAAIARMVGLSEKTVRNVIGDSHVQG